MAHSVQGTLIEPLRVCIAKSLQSACWSPPRQCCQVFSCRLNYGRLSYSQARSKILHYHVHDLEARYSRHMADQGFLGCHAENKHVPLGFCTPSGTTCPAASPSSGQTNRQASRWSDLGIFMCTDIHITIDDLRALNLPGTSKSILSPSIDPPGGL